MERPRGISEAKWQLLNLPSGPIHPPRKKEGKDFTLVGTFFDFNEMNRVRCAKGVVEGRCYIYKTVVSTTYDCPRCKEYKLKCYQNADRFVLYETGKHNHEVRPIPFHPKPVIDSRAIDETIDEVINMVARSRVNGETGNKANNVPSSSLAPKQPTSKTWKRHTKIEKYDDMVDYLMAQGFIPIRRATFEKGLCKRFYLCSKCHSVALSYYRHPGGSCDLYESNKEHDHELIPTVAEHLKLFYELDPAAFPDGYVAPASSSDAVQSIDDDLDPVHERLWLKDPTAEVYEGPSNIVYKVLPPTEPKSRQRKNPNPKKKEASSKAFSYNVLTANEGGLFVEYDTVIRW